MYILKENTKKQKREFVTFINKSYMTRKEFKDRIKMIKAKYPNDDIIVTECKSILGNGVEY